MKVKFREISHLLNTIISVRIKRLFKLISTCKTTVTTKINEKKTKGGN